MAARTIENENNRRMTMITTTMIPCGAKLPVIALISGSIMGGAWWMAPSMYFMGIAAVVISCLILKKFRRFSSQDTPFVMELPDYHLPAAKSMMIHVWDRVKGFLIKAGTVLFLCCVIMWFLGNFGFSGGSFGMTEADSSLLAAIGGVIAPIFAPLGFGSWQLVASSISGFAAKESIVSTMSVLAGPDNMRKDKPFVTINCGAIPDNLLESELFGYEKGAFTGAMQSGKEGLLEVAEGGTVFLDEIGETPLDFQVKLLRFLETKEVRRVGSTKARNIDVRVLAATNRDLMEMIDEGTFREDLYYRLNVVQITVPSLKVRKDDIMPLASFFLQKYNKKYGQEKLLTFEIVEELEKHEWVGNVRELKNVIENMVIVSNNEYLQIDDLPWAVTKRPSAASGGSMIEVAAASGMTLTEASEEVERMMITNALETCSSTRELAAKLGVNQSTIVRKMQKYGIRQ